MSQYFDYHYRFPVAGIAVAVGLLDALRGKNILGEGAITNMLGDPMDASGKVTDGEAAVFRGRQSGAYIYLSTRAMVDPKDLGIDLSAYGLEPVDEKTSAAILGVWA